MWQYIDFDHMMILKAVLYRETEVKQEETLQYNSKNWRGIWVEMAAGQLICHQSGHWESKT